MENDMQKILYDTAMMVLEEMCFIFPEPDEAEKDPERTPEAESAVAFDGPFSGKLIIKVYGGMLPVIATNMLGEESISKEQHLDALGEFANVICGNLLSDLSGPAVEFNIQHPEVTRNPAPPSDEQPKAEVTLTFDEGELGLWLYIDRG